MYNGRKNWYNQRVEHWKRELRLVSWNDAAPRLDIRDWAPGDTKVGKGITLTEDEARALKGLLEKYLG